MLRSSFHQVSLCLGLWLAVELPMCAQPVRNQPTADNPASGLRLDAEAMARLIGDPPSPGSPRDQNDQAILLWLQRTRTPEMVSGAWIPLEKSLGYFNRAVGGDLRSRAPNIYAAVIQFLKPIEVVKDSLKDRWNRKRPFPSISQIRPCLPAEVNASYPSGHAIWYSAAGRLLADLFPERADRLITAGQSVAYVRVTCGVHYPSDVLAGHVVAEESVRTVLASPQWHRLKTSSFFQEERSRIQGLSPKAGLPTLYFD